MLHGLGTGVRHRSADMRGCSLFSKTAPTPLVQLTRCRLGLTQAPAVSLCCHALPCVHRVTQCATAVVEKGAAVSKTQAPHSVAVPIAGLSVLLSACLAVHSPHEERADVYTTAALLSSPLHWLSATVLSTTWTACLVLQLTALAVIESRLRREALLYIV